MYTTERGQTKALLNAVIIIITTFVISQSSIYKYRDKLLFHLLLSVGI